MDDSSYCLNLAITTLIAIKHKERLDTSLMSPMHALILDNLEKSSELMEDFNQTDLMYEFRAITSQLNLFEDKDEVALRAFYSDYEDNFDLLVLGWLKQDKSQFVNADKLLLLHQIEKLKSLITDFKDLAADNPLKYISDSHPKLSPGFYKRRYI